jgi:hypothetical protein
MLSAVPDTRERRPNICVLCMGSIWYPLRNVAELWMTLVDMREQSSSTNDVESTIIPCDVSVKGRNTLGSDSVYSGRSLPKFRRNIQLPSSGYTSIFDLEIGWFLIQGSLSISKKKIFIHLNWNRKEDSAIGHWWKIILLRVLSSIV